MRQTGSCSGMLAAAVPIIMHGTEDDGTMKDMLTVIFMKSKMDVLCDVLRI